MRIKELHVYGYGKLENERFNDLQQLYVFFGENEAGKSTIMSFIHSMLFGFPSKNHEEPRYEPKQQAKYGGRLVLITERYGEVMIERVKGKAAGDVTVTLESGEVRSEKTLHDILHGIDKSYFQSVFSFNLQGLQGVHTMNEGNVGKILLSAGLIGNDVLLEAENTLQKEMEQRFKPAGQKPSINLQLKKIKELDKQMKLAGDEQEAYKALIEQHKQYTEELAEVKMKSSENEEMQYRYQEFLRIKPIVDERNILDRKLDFLGEQTFIADGIQRLEQFLAAKVQIHSQVVSLTERKQAVLKEQAERKPNEYIQDHKEEIEAALESASFLEKMELEQSVLLQELDRIQKDIRNAYGNLHYPGDETSLLTLDLSNFVKEYVKRLDRDKNRLLDERKQLDEEYKTEKEKLERSEARIAELKERMLPEEKRQQLEETVGRVSNESFQTLKKVLLMEQLAEVEQQYEQQKKRETQNRLRQRNLFGLLGILLAAGAVYSFTQDQVMIGLLLTAGLFILIASRSVFKGQGLAQELSRQLDTLKRKKAALDQEKPIPAEEHTAQLDLLERDREVEKSLRNEMFRHEEREMVFDKSIQKFEGWEHSWKTVYDEILVFHKNWRIKINPTENNLEVIFDMLSQLKALVLEKEEKSNQLTFLKKEITDKTQELLTFSRELGKTTASWKEAVVLLKKALNETLEKTIQSKQLLTEIEKLTLEIEKLTNNRSQIDEEIKTLYNKTGTGEEEEYRQKALKAEEWASLTSRRDLLQIQLQQSQLGHEQIADYLTAQIDGNSLERLSKERKEQSKRQSQLLEQLSDLKHVIQNLEDGGTYEERMHLFMEERAALNEEAKVWGRYAIAKTLLEQTVNSFKQERLPAVIALAEDYFSFLTDGEYTKIRINDSGKGLLVERNDRLTFEAEELSRGTAEQIYASMRLALAVSTFGEDPFPLIIDDGFVNFDQKRTRNMIKLLRQLSETRQIIFFTCHETLLTNFSDSEIHVLKKPNTHSFQ